MGENEFILKKYKDKLQHPIALRRSNFAFRFFVVYVQRRLT
jgi:hypothetical protein